MSSFLLMFAAVALGVLLAIPTFGLSLLLPALAWYSWVKPRDTAERQQRQQRPQAEPEPRRSWFFGGFWW